LIVAGKTPSVTREIEMKGTLRRFRPNHAGKHFAALLMLPLLMGATPPHRPPPPRGAILTAGETFGYRVRLGRLGTVGRATMRTSGPTEVRGRTAYMLSFDVRARILFTTVNDSTRSWVDSERMATLRYYKRENSPLAKGVESVEVFPEEGRWTAGDGKSGETACAHPLDELSFIYFLRTLPLEAGDSYLLEHHFDPGRNPVTVTVLRRETWTGPVAAGPVVVLEMKVRDPRHVGANGSIRFTFTDDARRIPVRIESSVPVFGSMVLTLESLQP
jgi:hypothetical protein